MKTKNAIRPKLANIGRLACALILVAAVVGCDSQLVLNDIEAIKARGELVVITRNNTACYFEGPHGPTGNVYAVIHITG